MKIFDFIKTMIPHNLKDPHSKALEPDRLSPSSKSEVFHITTQSPRGEGEPAFR
jgi:hypothetical protein